jgi:hypothetical protein
MNMCADADMEADHGDLGIGLRTNWQSASRFDKSYGEK